MTRLAPQAAALLLVAGAASAQPGGLDVTVGGVSIDRGAAAPLVLAVDADDDDEDGAPDAAEEAGIPTDDLLAIHAGGRVPVEVRVSGDVRLVKDGRAVGTSVSLRGEQFAYVQGVRASSRAGDAGVEVRGPDGTVRVPLTVVGLAILDAHNRPLDATRDAVGIAHVITNDATLPRRSSYGGTAANRDDVRLEVWDPSVEGNEIRAVIESGEADAPARTARPVVLRRPRAGLPFRSPWLRLVGDDMDQAAPGVGDRVLRVALRDEVRLRYPESARSATQSVRVGRPGDEDGARAARRGRLRIRVLRAAPGGMPSVGGDDEGAIAVGRRQVSIANEIWLQCFAGFGDPDEADVAVVDPPLHALLAVADRDGLPARGGGVIRLTVGGRPIRPVTTRPGALPVQTALAVAAAIRDLGHRPRVTENARAEHGAHRSADIVVRDANGAIVAIAPEGSHPLTTDAQQTLAIGSVDLSDGMQEFDNMTASAGTLEERTLIKTLADDDPATVDLFIVNHFTGGTRQGEAFIEADGGAIINALILDRNGIRQEREAWTQSHELGHILLNQPYHPDNVGPDRPWLLMDADSSLGLVTGPKRLRWDECHRARTQSGTVTVPTLLGRHAPRPETPPATGPYDRGYPRP